MSFVPRGIETGTSDFRAFGRLMHLAFQKPDPILSEVWTHWRAVGVNGNARLLCALRTAGLLLEAEAGDLAAKVLDNFSHAHCSEALADCEALVEAAHAGLRVLEELEQDLHPVDTGPALPVDGQRRA